MILLESVRINKYKSIQEPQSIEIDQDITTLVGMNEAGKTAVLEALSKFNYFDDDEKFKFNPTLDYPRRELKRYQRSSERVEVVRCNYTIIDDLLEQIEEDVGEDILKHPTFSMKLNYEDSVKTVIGLDTDWKKYLYSISTKYDISDDEIKIIDKLESLKEINDIDKQGLGEGFLELIQNVNEKIIKNSTSKWEDALSSYVYQKWISPNIPKFWYYDEYFNLPSRINLNELQQGKLDNESSKTAKALLEVAQVDLDELLDSSDYESFIAELEATSNEITDQMFNYWTTNKNLEINFTIDSKKEGKILDIRIKNQKHRVTLPLNQRSKGFTWFFSFIVWFSKIKYDESSNYILLLDEPGLNLHASAQADLLRFIEDLSDKYQVIYTTHSPFMVNSKHLDKVRTVFEGEKGTIVSDSIQEKDNKTLFPLQAALGYELAQNLFVSENNLLVEGPADLIYLGEMSEILKGAGKEGLRDDIVMVPVGGLDKIPAFISLMTGNNLKLVALLDSFATSKGSQKLDDLVKRKIIEKKKIRFFDEFVNNMEKADVEDLFTKGEYLKFFRAAYPEEKIMAKDIVNKNNQVIPQINAIRGKKRYNHYLPAREFLKMGVTHKFFTETTIKTFEKLFKTINKLFD